MFHNIPDRVSRRMAYLVRLDARHRNMKTIDHFERLRQVPPATGQFLALMAASAPKGKWLELGTSGGYSTMWLSVAARERGRKIVTFEVSDAKVALALETFKSAGIEDLVGLVHGDALKYLHLYEQVAFCFLDLEKRIYKACYEALIPNMVSGGILVADNVISHREESAPLVKRALSDKRVDAEVVPIGSGLLLARKA